MTEDSKLSTPRFVPLRLASRWRRIAVFVIGPCLWLVALFVVAVLLKRTSAIELGLAIAMISYLLSLAILALLYAGRRREEKRYAARG